MKYLILIDVQNDFITDALRNEEAIRKLPNIIKKVLDTDENTKILATKDTHHGNYLETYEGKNLPVPHCIDGTWGWGFPLELNNALANKNFKNEDVICKPTFGSFDLAERILKESNGNIEEIEIVGYCTDICVLSNALILRAKFPNIKIIVDANCCAGVTVRKHNAALDVMQSCQINIINETYGESHD